MDDSTSFFGNPNYGVILGFLRGERPDWQGRWLSEIRDWDDSWLEQDHHYIQWMFPLTTESESVISPRLREFEVIALQHDSKLQRELILSLTRMLRFLGFACAALPNELRIVPAHNFAERSKVWMSLGNHNFHRISRILGSLHLAGLCDYAAALLEALERVYCTPGGRDRIDQIAIGYWRQYARKGSGTFQFPTVSLTRG